MENVHVSKKVFDALNLLWEKSEGDLQYDIGRYIPNFAIGVKWIDERYAALNELDLNTFLKCIYCGYELEETAEDKLLSLYNEMNELGERGFYRGIEKTLEILNIKIDGINKGI